LFFLLGPRDSALIDEAQIGKARYPELKVLPNG